MCGHCIDMEEALYNNNAMDNNEEFHNNNNIRQSIPNIHFLDNKLEKNVNITEKALKRTKELGISISDINIEGIIKVSDVEKFHQDNNTNNIPDLGKASEVDNSTIKETIILTGNKKTGKDLMLKSVTSIPQSYAEIDIELGNLEDNLKSYSTKKGSIVTILSVFICAIGRVLEKQNIFNSFRDANQINIYKDVNIGKHRKVNLMLEPFNLEKPFYSFKDHEEDKFIYFYKKSALDKIINQNQNL